MAEKDEHSKVDKKEGQKPSSPPKRVVVTYGVKRQEDDEIPTEILPHEPVEVVKSPVESDLPPVTGKIGGSATIKSHVYPELPDEILPRRSGFSTQKPKNEEPISSGSPPSSQDIPPISPKVEQNASGLALFLSILTSIAVIALMFFAYFSQQQLTSLQTQTLDDKTAVSTLTVKAKDSLAQFKTMLEANTKERAALTQLQQELERSQARFIMLRGNRDWVLSEVNYLVFMANERLLAAKDIPTAVAQLKLAEERLTSLADPSLLFVKTALSQDIAKLLNTPQVNRQALWTEVGSLLPLIATLKFKILGGSEEKKETISSSTSTWKAALEESWHELKSLIKVTRIESNPIPVAFTQQEQAQILRTLQLLNQQAQWAVLEGDSQVYLNSLQSLSAYVKSYFVENTDQTVLLSRVQQLEQQRVEMPLPDISQSLQALSSVLSSKKE